VSQILNENGAGGLIRLRPIRYDIVAITRLEEGLNFVLGLIRNIILLVSE
jgi:hypothetical protein